MYACGNNSTGQLGMSGSLSNSLYSIPSFTGASFVSAGNGHTLVLFPDGTVMGVGENDYGELGLGNFVSPQYTPTLIPGISNAVGVYTGASHSAILLSKFSFFSFYF